MSVGHKIIEPSGKYSVVFAEDHDQIVDRVNSMQEKWQPYCERNWLNDTGGVYTPEIKTKTFLDSLAYFLLLGHTDGIETNYRRVMHGKREIPMSSCPSDFENLFYASCGSSVNYSVEERDAFRLMLEMLDERALPYEAKKQKKKEKSLFSKKIKNGICDGTWYRVDTDGKFWIGNNQYIIDDQEVKYQPVHTDYGDYYSMDKVLAANGKFYDMNYDEINVRRIGGILPYESFVVGTET